ncbi:MAG: response regulator, partial [Phycisphaeraceae bacterium]|nr:response regulator [Phycisphaeraceae bacterium]
MEKAKKKTKPPKTDRQAAPSEATVFIVEDDAVMRGYLEELIRSVDLHVESFDSAETFLKHYSLSGPACMLLDVRMPGMSGLELQEKLRNEKVELPILIITAHADVPMAVRAMHSGAFDFIEKPVNAQSLLERVRHAIKYDISHHRSKEFQDEIRERLEKLSPREH